MKKAEYTDRQYVRHNPRQNEYDVFEITPFDVLVTILGNTTTSVLRCLQRTENINAMKIMRNAKNNSGSNGRGGGEIFRRPKDQAMIKVCTNAAEVVDVALI